MDRGRRDGTAGTHMEPLVDATAAVPHPGLLVVAGDHDATRGSADPRPNHEAGMQGAEQVAPGCHRLKGIQGHRARGNRAVVMVAETIWGPEKKVRDDS